MNALTPTRACAFLYQPIKIGYPDSDKWRQDTPSSEQPNAAACKRSSTSTYHFEVEPTVEVGFGNYI